MAGKPIHYTVKMNVKRGKLADAQKSLRKMANAAKKEPGTINYCFFVSENKKQITAHEWFTDSDALAAHVTSPTVNKILPEMLAAVDIAAVDVYGKPTKKAAQALEPFGAVYHEQIAGFKA